MLSSNGPPGLKLGLLQTKSLEVSTRYADLSVLHPCLSAQPALPQRVSNYTAIPLTVISPRCQAAYPVILWAAVRRATL